MQICEIREYWYYHKSTRNWYISGCFYDKKKRRARTLPRLPFVVGSSLLPSFLLLLFYLFIYFFFLSIHLIHPYSDNTRICVPGIFTLFSSMPYHLPVVVCLVLSTFFFLFWCAPFFFFFLCGKPGFHRLVKDRNFFFIWRERDGERKERVWNSHLDPRQLPATHRTQTHFQKKKQGSDIDCKEIPSCVFGLLKTDNE